MRMQARSFPLLIAGGLALVLIGCSTTPRLTVGTAAGFDRSKLLELVNEAASTGKNLHSLIIERHGQVVAELYRNGWNTSLSDGGGLVSLWSAMGRETLHDIRSGTKSLVALLAGTVLHRHPEYSVHSRISEFPELAAKAPEWALNLELGQFLSMSSGLAWKEWGQGSLTSDETPLVWEKDPVGYSIKRPLESEPGTRFNYSGGSTFIVSRILELIDGKSIAEIARSDLFEPLGITSWKWGKGWNGFFLPNAGIGLRSVDMLKVGELMLAQGNWHGKQIVPAAWVDQITAPLVKVQTNYFDLDEEGTSYGYFWWNGTINWMAKGTRWYSTVGNGGQKIFVVPRLDLVVVMTAGDYGNPDIQVWETNFLKSILEATRGV